MTVDVDHNNKNLLGFFCLSGHSDAPFILTTTCALAARKLLANVPDDIYTNG